LDRADRADKKCDDEKKEELNKWLEIKIDVIMNSGPDSAST
jgi:hypothetical protein